MSYSVNRRAVNGALGDMIVRWSNNISSSMFIAKGPTCGSQRAAQRMLQDLGYGAGRSDIEDPNFVSDMEKFANDRGIRHTVGTVDQAMCNILSQEWMQMARLDPKAAPYLVYERDPAKPKPKPMIVDYEAESRPPVIMPPGSIIPIDQLPPALRPQSSTAAPPVVVAPPAVVPIVVAPPPVVQPVAPAPSPAMIPTPAAPQVITAAPPPQVVAPAPQIMMVATTPEPIFYEQPRSVPAIQAQAPALPMSWKQPAIAAGGAAVGFGAGKAVAGTVGSLVGFLAGGAAGWFFGAKV